MDRFLDEMPTSDELSKQERAHARREEQRRRQTLGLLWEEEDEGDEC